jgi:hypothetical protein
VESHASFQTRIVRRGFAAATWLPGTVAMDLKYVTRLVNRIDPRVLWTSIRRGDMPSLEEAREMAGAIYAVGAAGTVALVLSATGLYAVLSYTSRSAGARSGCAWRSALRPLGSSRW